jgi:hypothetical protein
MSTAKDFISRKMGQQIGDPRKARIADRTAKHLNSSSMPVILHVSPHSLPQEKSSGKHTLAIDHTYKKERLILPILLSRKFSS